MELINHKLIGALAKLLAERELGVVQAVHNMTVAIEREHEAYESRDFARKAMLTELKKVGIINAKD